MTHLITGELCLEEALKAVDKHDRHSHFGWRTAYTRGTSVDPESDELLFDVYCPKCPLPAPLQSRKEITSE